MDSKDQYALLDAGESSYYGHRQRCAITITFGKDGKPKHVEDGFDPMKQYVFIVPVRQKTYRVLRRVMGLTHRKKMSLEEQKAAAERAWRKHRSKQRAEKTTVTPQGRKGITIQKEQVNASTDHVS